MTVVQDLEHDVEDIRVRLLNFVKENDAVGLAAHLFGQLAGLVVAYIARRRADDTADGEFLHKLRHIQTDERFGGIEHILCQALDQLGFSHAGGAYKDEGDRLALGGDAHPAAADGVGHLMDGFVLADDMGFEPLL